MSNREKCHALIEAFSDTQLASIAAMLESAKSLADEAEDDAYCRRLYADYQADPDKGDSMSLEGFAQSLGISLE